MLKLGLSQFDLATDENKGGDIIPLVGRNWWYVARLAYLH
jgi:hypothetical protein